MFGLGIQELTIILVIILILFGGKKLPELSRSVGESMKELRKGFNEEVTDKKENKNNKNEQSKSNTKS